MPEATVRQLIQQTGVKTFPRPKGIPENFLVYISDKGAGMKYVHPSNNKIIVRVMPGKPHSPMPFQQNPYVIFIKNDRFVNKFGKCVAGDAPESHIPLNEFVFSLE